MYCGNTERDKTLTGTNWFLGLGRTSTLLCLHILAFKGGAGRDSGGIWWSWVGRCMIFAGFGSSHISSRQTTAVTYANEIRIKIWDSQFGVQG